MCMVIRQVCLAANALTRAVRHYWLTLTRIVRRHVHGNAVKSRRVLVFSTSSSRVSRNNMRGDGELFQCCILILMSPGGEIMTAKKKKLRRDFIAARMYT